MTFQDLGGIGEFIGGIGVIATLLYLAAQIRTNTRSVRSSNHQDVQRGGRELMLAIAQDPELSRIWAAGVRDFDSLTPADGLRFGYLAMLSLNVYLTVEYAAAQGTLEEPMRADWREQLRRLCLLPGFAAWWDRNEAYSFPSAFEWLVSQLVTEGRGPAAQQDPGS